MASPRLLQATRSGRLWASIGGIREDIYRRGTYTSLNTLEEKKLAVEAAGSRRKAPRQDPIAHIRGYITAVGAATLYSPPYVRLDIGQSEWLPSITLQRAFIISWQSS